MKAAWDRLGSKWNRDASSVAIVDVDCTVHQSTCQRHGVQGYPTVQYFKNGATRGTAYQYGRDFDSLDRFVKSTLDVAKCNPSTGKHCRKNELRFIEQNKGKSANELEDMLAERKKKVTDLKKEMEAAEKAYKAKAKEYKKRKKMFTHASHILNSLIKSAKSGKKDL